LTSAGASAPVWATISGFPSGTVLLFGQTSAPTGYTKDTTNYNNSALRVVTGNASTGGSVDFTTAFTSQAVAGTVGSTTLSEAQMPAHTHTGQTRNSGAGTDAQTTGSSFNTFGSMGTAGSSNSHTHSFSGTAINLAVKYVDIIRATKD
jgi:microcystin-dependent protein